VRLHLHAGKSESRPSANKLSFLGVPSFFGSLRNVSLLSSELPLLSWDDVLVFPGTATPVIISGSTAQELFHDALGCGGLVGMALRDTDGDGVLGVHSVGCTGEIYRREHLADGMWRLLVRGKQRFRIRGRAECARSYSVAVVQILHEAPVLAHEMRPLRDRVRAAIEDYEQALGAEKPVADRFFDKLDVEGLVNHLCVRLPWSPVEKQRLLECATVEHRCRDLVALIRHRAAEGRLGLKARREADA